MKLILYAVYLALLIAAVIGAVVYLLPLVNQGNGEYDFSDQHSPIVAVLDTGVDGDHRDLKGSVVATVNLGTSDTGEDIHGHGTHLAGIIMSVCEECSLLSVKVTDDRGRVDADTLASGITWAVDNGADVLCIALTLAETSDSLKSAVGSAIESGVVVVAAAGTRGSVWYPAFYDECIAVTATMPDGSLVPLVNRSEWVDTSAPGYEVYSTLPNDSYGCKSGTSQATAYVAGMMAISES